MIHVKCACGETYHADDSQLGRALKCRRCGNILTIEAQAPTGSEDLPHPGSTRATYRPPGVVVDVPPRRPTVSPRKEAAFRKAAAVVLGLVCIVFLVYAISVQNARSKQPPSTRATAVRPASSYLSQYVEPTKPSPTATSPWGRLASDVVPLTGHELWTPTRQGAGELVVENGTESDAVVKLVNDETGRTERIVFVRAGDTARVYNIAIGRYTLLYGLGWDLTAATRTFSRHARYGEFERPFLFEETSQHYTIWETTLHTVAGGNARTSDIGEAAFTESDVR